jgi:hypothetical protein
MAVAIATLAGCASGGTAPGTARESGPRPVVVVRNDNWLDVNVYAVRGSSRFRLGTVRGNGTATLPLPPTLTGDAGGIRLLVDPIGSRGSYLTESIAVGPDQWVSFTVASTLALSSYAVWHRRP